MLLNIKTLAFIFFLFLSNSSSLISQTNIAVIDFNSISSQLVEHKIIHNGRSILIDNFKEIFTVQVNLLSTQLEQYSRSCPSPQEHKRFEAEIIYKQYQLRKFEAMFDSLIVIYDKKGASFIKRKIIENLKKHLDANQIEVDEILNKEGLLYVDPEIDYTDKILKMMTEERDLEFAQNETLHFINPIIEKTSNRMKLLGRTILKKLPDNIDIKELKKKIEALTMFKGFKKEYEYLKN